MTCMGRALALCLQRACGCVRTHASGLQEPHIELMQNMSPKVDAATMGPASYPPHPDNEWWVVTHRR